MRDFLEEMLKFVERGRDFERTAKQWASDDPFDKADSTETFEVIKNGVKTTAIISFNKKGYPLGVKVLTEGEEEKRKKVEKTIKEKLSKGSLDEQDIKDIVEQLEKFKTNK